MARKPGKKYPEKVSLLITTKMRNKIQDVKTIQDFVVEQDAFRFVLQKGLDKIFDNHS